MHDNLLQLLQHIIHTSGDPTLTTHVQHVLTFAPSDDALPWALLELVHLLSMRAEFLLAEQVLTHLFQADHDFDYEKAWAICLMATCLVERGQSNLAKAWLQRAQQWAQGVPEFWRKAELLNRIANGLLLSHHPTLAANVRQEAIRTAQLGEASANPQERVDSASVLWEIVQDVDRCGQKDDARLIAQSIQNLAKRQRALSSIDP